MIRHNNVRVQNAPVNPFTPPNRLLKNFTDLNIGKEWYMIPHIRRHKIYSVWYIRSMNVSVEHETQENELGRIASPVATIIQHSLKKKNRAV